MHKQRKYNSQSSRQHNANRELDESAIEAITSLLDDLPSSENVAIRYLRDHYLSKYCDESIVPEQERHDRAVKKWLDQEIYNARTNERLSARHPSYNVLPRITWKRFLKVARRIAYQILGPLTDDVLLGSFSGGATTSRSRLQSHPALKYIGKADITKEAEYTVDLLHHHMPLLRQYGAFTELSFVEGAKLFTVPKKSDINRCACKEPDINMFLQKGVGGYLRKRLRRFGIDLNDQSVNRKLAWQGSVTGDLATLDLSSASDSVTISCVKSLLPDDWFEYLNSIRSQVVLVGEEQIRTEMFSSMGNGFTFELESLIFFTLVRTVQYFEGVSSIISVYGDDVICSVDIVESVMWIFHEFGFKVNEDKSFSSGPFRESCGGHYYNGIDITPFYLKRRPTHLTDVIRVANQLRQWAFADATRRYEFPEVFQLWLKLALFVPTRLWGGCDYTVDTQLVAPFTPRTRLCRINSSVEVPPTGLYLLWHNSSWNNTSPGDRANEPIQATKICRERRVPPGALRYREYFWEEAFNYL